MSKNITFSKALHFELLWRAKIRRIPSLMKYVGISQNTAYRYKRMMEDHGFIEFKKRSGRKKQITPKVERKIIQKFRKMGHSRTVIGLSKKMHIGRESVRTIVIKNGYKWKKLRAKKLTEEQKSKRVDFCRTMLSDPSNIPFIIWTDETSFWLNKSKSGHGWVCRDGEDMDIESEAPINLNGPKVHVWGAISAKGKFKLYLFEENLTSELYIKILRSRLAEMKKVFPEGFYFMHDNDPKHTSRPVKEFAQKNLLEILPWPSYSPDFNPIERVWAWLKKKIAADSVENITELKKSIKKHWKSITTNYICNLINSLENRYQQAINHNGAFDIN